MNLFEEGYFQRDHKHTHICTHLHTPSLYVWGYYARSKNDTQMGNFLLFRLFSIHT